MISYGNRIKSGEIAVVWLPNPVCAEDMRRNRMRRKSIARRVADSALGRRKLELATNEIQRTDISSAIRCDQREKGNYRPEIPRIRRLQGQSPLQGPRI